MRHAADLDARLDKLDRDRRALADHLSLLGEANRELITMLCEGAAPSVAEQARKASERQSQRLGACSEQVVLLLREHEDALRSMRETLDDIRRALS